ncbi:MAG TPA: MBL fold metallo-hydrolase, partial [Acidimicrobiia bacterium]
QLASAPMFQEVGVGVFRRRYESLDSNVGVVVGEDGLLIVDTRATLAEGDELRADLGSFSPLPVRWVVNTHWHWDHVFGNARFPEAELWGHRRAREVLLSRPEEMKEGAKRWLDPARHAEIDAVEIVAPQMTFSDRVSIDIGRAVDLSFHGLGHTDADIRILVGDADVMFLGDLTEEGGPPSFGDSYPMIWPLTLRLALGDATGVIVPGHGDVVDRLFVEQQHGELVAVAELAAACISGDMSVGDAARRGPFPAEVMTGALERAIEVG